MHTCEATKVQSPIQMNVGLSILLSGVRGKIDRAQPNILTLLTCRQPPHRRRLSGYGDTTITVSHSSQLYWQ